MEQSLRRRSGKKAARKSKSSRSNYRHVVVMVLGDVGRSPRMQYHALSLAKLAPEITVSLLGYEGERCVPEIYAQRNIQLLTFQPVLSKIPRSAFLILAPIKVILQIFHLMWMLLVTAGTIDLLLLQNPPTIPTFIVAWICCRIKSASFVIDWHNLGYSILALSLGSSHPLVNVAKWIERVFGNKADANLCVTQEMQLWLSTEWGITATVVYDKPPQFFQPTSIQEQHHLFKKLSEQLQNCNDLVSWSKNKNNDETLFTRKVPSATNKRKKEIISREDRPAMLISSTSWTADEDFGVLLSALVTLDARIRTDLTFPNIVVVVTGKGPQKEYYLDKIRQLALQRIRIVTLWLEAADYPKMLGSADLGVCLHTSSSGLDLPMKVLDMFGCQVPVCAVNFPCLHELVQHDHNGMVFDTSDQLADQLFELVQGYPSQCGKLYRLQSSLKQVQHWPENWNRVAAPVFRKQLQL